MLHSCYPMGQDETRSEGMEPYTFTLHRRDLVAWVCVVVLAFTTGVFFWLSQKEQHAREQLDALVSGEATLVDMRGTKGIVAVRTRIEEATQPAPAKPVAPSAAEAEAGFLKMLDEGLPPFRTRADVLAYLATERGKQWSEGWTAEARALVATAPIMDAGQGFSTLNLSVPNHPRVLVLLPPMPK